MNKKLYIVSGVTGAVGNAFLARVAKEEGSVVYGISRKGERYQAFVDPLTGLLHSKTFVCSLGSYDDESIEGFLNLINVEAYDSIVYLHAIGYFPFEISKDGKHEVSQDLDGDGINDLTYDLSYRVFKSVTVGLKELHDKSHVPVTSIIIGSVADKYRPKEHESWWKTLGLTRTYMRKAVGSGFGMHLVNISSVVCAHEIITRPYVFIDTDADLRFWLSPSQLADYIVITLDKAGAAKGFHEHNLFNAWPSFDNNYYSPVPFKRRKMRELFGSRKQGNRE